MTELEREKVFDTTHGEIPHQTPRTRDIGATALVVKEEM